MWSSKPNETLVFLNPNIIAGSRISFLNNRARSSLSSAAGKFFADGSLDETDVKVTTLNNQNQKDSRTIGSYTSTANTAVTDIVTQGSFVDMNLGVNAVEGDNIERWELVDVTTGTLRYLDDKPFSGVLMASISAENMGPSQKFEFRAINQDGDTFGVITAVELTRDKGNVVLIVPIIVEPNDEIRLRVSNVDGTNDVAIVHATVNIQ